MRGKPTYVGRGYFLGSFVEDDPLHGVADVAAIEYMGDVRHRNHHEAAGMGRQRGLDPLLDGKERQRILFVGAVGVAHGDADLSDPPQSLFDQPLMARMKRLVASDEQRGRLLRVERRLVIVRADGPRAGSFPGRPAIFRE